MKGVIYQYKIKSKYYVGKTYTQERKRQSKHKYEAYTLKKEHPFYKAIRKYGWEEVLTGYSVLEVVEAETKQELNDLLIQREMFWITQKNSIVPNGYNIRSKGQSGIPTYNNKAEMYKKVSKSLKGKYMNAEHTSKRVFCVEEQKWYPSISEAERQHGGRNGTIGKVLSDTNVTAFGLHWSLTKQPSQREDLIKKSRKRVVCVETGQVYNSIYETAKTLFGEYANKKKCRIQNGIKNGWAVNGLHYEFLDK